MKLLKIQQELKAPKNQVNTFGKYKYRSCEDILEAVKPLLAKNECALTISDEIINVGNHNYVKATAVLSDEKGIFACVSASAREALEQKGMSDSQLTGATSSYARKYALNGLFAIDDTKDADTDEHASQGQNKPSKTMPEEKPLAFKVCPYCKAEHQGTYPKCMDCYKKEKAGMILEKAKPEPTNYDKPPF